MSVTAPAGAAPIVRRMTPADRDALIGKAKRAATPVVSCVAARITPAHILGQMSRAEVDALVIVLAEAVDHALLRTVIEAGDDDKPGAAAAAAGDGVPEETARLRAAHAEAARLRRTGLVVPTSIRILDNAYHDALREARAVVAPPDPQAGRNLAVLDWELREHHRARKAVGVSAARGAA